MEHGGPVNPLFRASVVRPDSPPWRGRTAILEEEKRPRFLVLSSHLAGVQITRGGDGPRPPAPAPVGTRSSGKAGRDQIVATIRQIMDAGRF